MGFNDGGFRDRNGIMYFAPGGPVVSTPVGINNPRASPPMQPPPPYQPPSYATDGGDPSNNHMTPWAPPPATSAQDVGAQGTQATMFGSLPYSSGVPMTNAFVANTPISNMGFSPGQYTGSLGQAQGTLSGLQSMLASEAQGGGPNLAAAQEKQATDRNISQAYAMAQANPNNPGAMRNIASNVAGINQQAASDSAQQRMQQQLAAQQQLGQIGLGTYGTSGSLLTDAQRLALSQAQGNQQAALNAQTINAATSLGNQQYGANVLGTAINAGGAVLGHVLSGGNTGQGSPYGAPPDAGLGSNYPSSVPTGQDTGGSSGGGFGDYGGGDTGYAAYGGMAPNFNGPVRHYDEGGYVSEMPNQYNPGAIAAQYDYTGKSQVPDARLAGMGSGGGGGGGGYGAQGQRKGGGGDFGEQAGNYLNYIPAFGAFAATTYKLGDYGHMFDSPTGLDMARYKNTAAANKSKGSTGSDWYAAPAEWASGLFSSGGPVPGQAQKSGNSYDNDTVPAMLSPKEIVLPRSVTMDPDAPDKAKAFVEAIRRKQRKAA